MTLAAHTSLRAPFPWPGGKRRVADDVWAYLGNPGRYVEPFAGSLGVLLGRPEPIRGLEVVNDIDGYVVNVWRALRADPLGTVRWADDLRSEYDLTARHLWLVNEGRARLRAGLQTDPEWFDAQTAGWWLYGVAMWIGDAFASGTGPWTEAAIHAAESKLPHLGDDGRGVHRQLPHLGDDGRGVHRKLPHLGNDGQGVHRQLPHLGDDGRGVHRQLPHLGNDGQGVHRQLPHLGNDGQGGSVLPGVYALAERLAQRLSRVVITNGEWHRVLTPSATRAASGHTAVYLDPPYDGYEDAYASSGDVWDAVVEWCEQAPTAYRIVLSGYTGARAPRGWREVAYTATGTSSANRTGERFWVSAACGGQQSLLAEGGAT